MYSCMWLWYQLIKSADYAIGWNYNNFKTVVKVRRTEGDGVAPSYLQYKIMRPL